MLLISLLLLAFAVLGHVILWVAVVNRIHACAWPSWTIAFLTYCCFALLLLPLCILFATPVSSSSPFFSLRSWGRPALTYLAFCSLVTVFSIGNRIAHSRNKNPSAVLLAKNTCSLNLYARFAPLISSNLLQAPWMIIPGNQSLRLSIDEKILLIERLPATLHGLRIAHLSDFHLNGRIGKNFFQEVAHLTSERHPDLIAITGDLFDNSQCLEWIPDIFGELKSRHGIYFVWGNHDYHIDRQRAALELLHYGAINLTSRWKNIALHGQNTLLAGNALPWFTPNIQADPVPEAAVGKTPLRLLLSHTPDQISWAQQRHFDLMLAGHTHGGQYCLPLVGPLVTPSQYGTKYAQGIYYKEPTVLHVVVESPVSHRSGGTALPKLRSWYFTRGPLPTETRPSQPKHKKRHPPQPLNPNRAPKYHLREPVRNT